MPEKKIKEKVKRKFICPRYKKNYLSDNKSHECPYECDIEDNRDLKFCKCCDECMENCSRDI